MNNLKRIFCLTICSLGTFAAMGQNIANMDLSTRWMGSSPSNQTVSSVQQWLQNPMSVNLEVGVTNLYADTNGYLEIDIGDRKLTFYGAGLDSLGNYIPTNYPPVEVDASLRRLYTMNMVCPNSGPNGSPLFQLSDIPDPYDLGQLLSTSGPPSAISAYLWNSFSPAAQSAIINDNPSTDPGSPVARTNLVEQLNAIITSGLLNTNLFFGTITLNTDTLNLLNQVPFPQGQQLVLLNRLLLRDAYYGHYGGLLGPGQSDNSGTAQINLVVNPPTQFVINPYKPVTTYTVQVNGPQFFSGTNVEITLLNQGTGYLSTNYSTVLIQSSKFAHFGVGDGSDDPTIPPGTAKWLRMGPGCTQDTNAISLQWMASLGRTFDGLAAGELGIYETGLSSDSYTPYGIFYNGSMTNLYEVLTLGSSFSFTNLYSSVILVTTNIAEVETNDGIAYTNYDNLLRQVKSYQSFVDIQTPDTNDTVLNFYLSSQVGTNEDQNGLFTNISGSPFVTWTLQNPSPGSATALNIIENRNGILSTQFLAETASAGGVTWTLTQGSGSATRVETRQVSFTGTPATGRIEMDTVSYSGSSTPAFQCQETYNFYPWGSELVETRVPNNPDYITSYQYYDTTDGSDPDDPNGYGYGQLKSTVYPNGYWELRKYWTISLLEAGNYIVPMEIFHPYFDAVMGGTADINEANESNCSVTQWSPVWFPDWTDGIDTGNNGDLMRTWDEGVPVNGQATGSRPWPYSGPYTEPSEADATDSASGQMTFTDYGPPTETDMYADDGPSGLAGHTVLFLGEEYTAKQNFHYYDHGVFDTSANSFTLDPANHFYTFAGVTNQYPDHRETIIDNGWSGGSWGGGDGISDPSSIDDYDEYPWDATAEGHYLYTGPYVQVDTSMKHTRIYHSGDLAQTEDYVYAGSSDGETGPIENSDAEPLWTMLTKVRYYCDSLGRPTNIVRIDPISNQTRTLYTANYRGTTGYDGELLFSETDQNGKTTSYTYDGLQRVISMTVTGYGSQPNKTTSLTYDANGNVLTQTTSAGSLSQSQSAAYDLVGRVTNQVDTSGMASQISYSADNLTQTTTLPGGITNVRTYGIDEHLESVTGNGSIPQFYDHEDDNDSYILQNDSANVYIYTPVEITHLGYANSPRWTGQGTDVWGHDGALMERPAGASFPNIIWTATNYWYENIEFAIASPGLPITEFGDDYYDRPSFTSVQDSVDQNRETWSQQRYTQIGSAWYQATTNWVYLTDGSETPTVSSIHLVQINGFTGSQSACAIDYDADTNETIAITTINRAQDESTVTTSEPYTSSLSAVSTYQNGLLISSNKLSVANPTLYFYDALGRTNQIEDPLGFSTYMTYDPNTGWITSITDPANNTTLYTYYNTNEANAGKLKCQTDPNGKNTYYAYTTQGQLYQTWGDVPYPSEYVYNEYGDLTNLITFRGGSGWNSPTWPSSPGTGDNTYWSYDEASGALLQKKDAQGNSVNYTYDPNTAMLVTHSWARTVGGVNVTETNSYDGFQDLISQSYNDGTSNVYFNNYNRAGQPREIVDASGTNELTYDYASRLISSVCTNGLLTGIAISNHFNPYLGRDSVSVLGLSSPLQDNYGYDSYGRLSSVSSGTCSATYGYMPNSDLLQSTIFQNGSSTVLTTTRSWQYGYRLGCISNVVNGAIVTSHAYTYDSVNRRTRAQLEDGSIWNYGYNGRNEVTGANRYWNDGTPVSGQQYGYAYDNIGNRQSATFGGDTNGLNLQSIAYSANNLDQYTSITTPGAKDIEGVAYTINNVSVNGALADRKWMYFHNQISIANTNQPIWQNVTNISGTFTNRGGLVFPANGQTLVYDADGNLSFDGIWNYQWDGKNELISMTMTNISGIANSNRLQLAFSYDGMGRRIAKFVLAWNGEQFIPESTNYFIYDGWNLLAIINPESTGLQSFMWGNDLSGSLDQAGGVGGLLMSTFSGTNCFAAYDGNGNITALINAADMSVAARYEYSPFGELIRSTGIFTRQNPFRFSTKFCDDESGLVYNNFRYYSPVLGRWISRDSSGEKDNRNLYGFVHNSPIIMFDRNGKESVESLVEALLAEIQDYGNTAIGLRMSWLNDDEFSDVLTDTVGGYITDALADMVVQPDILSDEGEEEMATEIQEGEFMENAKNIIVGRIQSQTAMNNMVGLVVGLAAEQINENGGNGDDFILNAALNAAATSGVDSSEDIYGMASEVDGY